MPTVDQIRHGITSRSTAMTCAVDGRDHLISDQATQAGLAADHGQYVAICGHVVLAAPMVVPPGPTCFDCEAALHRITSDQTNSHRRRGRVARLLHRLCLPANLWSATSGSHRAVGR